MVLGEAGLERWWEQQLMAGFHQGRVTRRLEIVGTVDFAGDTAPTGPGEYHLHVFPHPFLLDGRYSNEPWAWETPEPMTGQVWDTWGPGPPGDRREARRPGQRFR